MTPFLFSLHCFLSPWYLSSIAFFFSLPPNPPTGPARAEERRQQKEEVQTKMWKPFERMIKEMIKKNEKIEGKGNKNREPIEENRITME